MKCKRPYRTLTIREEYYESTSFLVHSEIGDTILSSASDIHR